MNCIGKSLKRRARDERSGLIIKLWLGLGILVCIGLNEPSHAQIKSSKTLPDQTQIRGAEIITEGKKLTDETLKAAFSGYVHYGTYILNAQNKITSTYSEYHYQDGRVDYSDSDGDKSIGRWASRGSLICYRYKGKSPVGGGCYEIYELDSCYYFFNDRGLYDGFSTRYKIGQEPARSYAEAEPRCIPLIG